MQWSPDLNAGFSRANPQRLYLPPIIDPAYHYQAINVGAQQENRESLLWWMKRLIAMRKRHQAFGRGSLAFLTPDNHRILAFIRRYRDEVLLVVANLSRFVQPVALDLAEFRGRVPVEVFGRTAFPVLTRKPLFLTLAPYAFYWMDLEPQRVRAAGTIATTPETQLPLLTIASRWEQVFVPPNRAALEAVLAAYLPTCGWFGGRQRPLGAVRVQEAVLWPQASQAVFLTLLQVEYLRGDPETYAIPVACATGGHRALPGGRELRTPL
jgi:maltose alpha-D-glucosyltransferase/alpha-amylase